MTASSPLTDRAHRRLFGESTVNQDPEKVIRRIRIGKAKAAAEATSWPQSAADVSPLAAALVAATKRGKS